MVIFMTIYFPAGVARVPADSSGFPADFPPPPPPARSHADRHLELGKSPPPPPPPPPAGVR